MGLQLCSPFFLTSSSQRLWANSNPFRHRQFVLLWSQKRMNFY